MNGETWNMEDLKDLAPSNFLRTALSLMAYQASNNAVYNEWIQSMKLQLDSVEYLEQIPFLPIHFFKTHTIYTGTECPRFYFESSGTTQDTVSKHFVKGCGHAQPQETQIRRLTTVACWCQFPCNLPRWLAYGTQSAK
jgi:hypothetical protein